MKDEQKVVYSQKVKWSLLGHDSRSKVNDIKSQDLKGKLRKNNWGPKTTLRDSKEDKRTFVICINKIQGHTIEVIDLVCIQTKIIDKKIIIIQSIKN